MISVLDGFLLISTHPEGLPVCLLEAMGAGLPWLATNKGGITDIAFDPSSSTRVIASALSYEEIKQQVILLRKIFNQVKWTEALKLRCMIKSLLLPHLLRSGWMFLPCKKLPENAVTI